jgi:hypothetical protein
MSEDWNLIELSILKDSKKYEIRASVRHLMAFRTVFDDRQMSLPGPSNSHRIKTILPFARHAEYLFLAP